MAVVLGVSSGFVTTAPTADPNGTTTVIDGRSCVTKDTSPAGATVITEIGWFRSSGTNPENFQIALYSDSSGVAGTRLYVDTTNSSLTGIDWIRVTVNWAISANTPYWLALQMGAHSGSSNLDFAASGGAGADMLLTQTALNDPYGGGALDDADGMYSIYALVEITSGESHEEFPADSIGFADASTKSVGKASADSATFSDQITGKVIGKVFADTVNFIDVPSKQAQKVLGDSVSLSDGINVIKITSLELSDSITFTDTSAKSVQKTQSDTVIFSDAVIKQVNTVRSDAITFSDARIKQVNTVRSDTVSFSDVGVKQISKTQSDAITFSDARIKQVNTVRSDAITLSDALAKQTQKTFSDQTVFSEARQKLIGKIFSDGLSLVDEETIDLLSSIIDLELNDSISLADVSVRNLGKILTDQALFADVVDKSFVKLFSDQVLFADVEDVELIGDIITLDLSDFISLTDGASLNLIPAGPISFITLRPNELCNGGTFQSVFLNEDARTANHNTYVGCIIVITSGPGEGQSAVITNYNKSNNTVMFTKAWKMAPTSSSSYIIVPSSTGYIIRGPEQAQDAGMDWIVLTAGASLVDNAYTGALIVITSGIGFSETYRIDGYNGTSKRAKIVGAWRIAPNSSSEYVIIP